MLERSYFRSRSRGVWITFPLKCAHDASDWLTACPQCVRGGFPPVFFHLLTELHFSAGESGRPGSRGDQQEDAGPDASRVRRRPATDLHADAQGLLPTIPLLQHLQVAHSRRLAYLLRVLVHLSSSDPDPALNRIDARPFHRFTLTQTFPEMISSLFQTQICQITAKTLSSLLFFFSPPHPELFGSVANTSSFSCFLYSSLLSS